jgi:hypothetical protein
MAKHPPAPTTEVEHVVELLDRPALGTHQVRDQCGVLLATADEDDRIRVRRAYLGA